MSYNGAHFLLTPNKSLESEHHSLNCHENAIKRGGECVSDTQMRGTAYRSSAGVKRKILTAKTKHYATSRRVSTGGFFGHLMWISAPRPLDDAYFSMNS